MAREISRDIGVGRTCWIESVYNDNIDNADLSETDLIVTVGGDGTILRSARAAIGYDVPILGVNMGRLGFMTELRAEEAVEKIPGYLSGDGWLEERSMLSVAVVNRDDAGETNVTQDYDALNDAVLARGAEARLIRVDAFVDGSKLTSYRADAVIVSTATGSTGYNLSAGGPILAPTAEEMIIKPVAPHVGLATAVVLGSATTIKLVVESEDGAILSLDGFREQPIDKNDELIIKISDKKVRFLRRVDGREFYASLTRRLGFEGGLGAGRAVFY